MATRADRQLATYAKTNDFTAVVDQIVEETLRGCAGLTLFVIDMKSRLSQNRPFHSIEYLQEED